MDPTVLEGYTDANWINVYEVARFSHLVEVLCLGAQRNIHTFQIPPWQLSHVALATCSKEVEWLRNLMIVIPLWPKPMPLISIHCDSQATLSKTYCQVYIGKSRHIGLRHSYVSQLISDGVLTINFVRSCQNLVDSLTRFSWDMVSKTSQGIGLKSISQSHQ